MMMVSVIRAIVMMAVIMIVIVGGSLSFEHRREAVQSQALVQREFDQFGLV